MPQPAIRKRTPDYRLLFEAAGDLVYTLDLQGRFTLVNPAFVRVTGYSMPELIGRHFSELLTPASARLAQRHFSRGVRGIEPTPFFEVDVLRKNGGLAHLEVRAGSLLRNGGVVGRQGIARDIGELKRLQALAAQSSQRIAMLEQQTHLALSLCQRIVVRAAPDNSQDANAALHEMRELLAHANALKLGLNGSDLIVLDLLAGGRSNREIAAAVFRSVNTIKERLSKIMQCLGVSRRADAVRKALTLGLIERQPSD